MICEILKVGIVSYLVIKNDQKYDLYSFIYENISKSNYTEYRDVDNSIGLITNLIEKQSRLIKILFEKDIISKSELEEFLSCNDFHIEKI